MGESFLWTVGCAALLAAALTYCLARRAVPWNWVDAPSGVPGGRKLQSRPVPPVGGAAILLTLFLLELWGMGPWAGGREATRGTGPQWSFGIPIGAPTLSGLGVSLSLAAVFLVGLVDDCTSTGLRPRLKLLGQTVALLPLGWAALEGGAGGPSVLAVLTLALLAVNVLNTFDNADGAVALTALIGFGAPLGSSMGSGILPAGRTAAGALGSVLGFLPFNLAGRGGGGEVGVGPGSRAPRAYLGDSGAYVLALLLLLHPTAWTALWIPLLDLGRLSVLRLLVGSRPWIGDRRHLAHRLQSRGMGPIGTAALLACLALPGCLASAWFPGSPRAVALGLLLGAFGFIGTLYSSCPCPRRCASE